MHVLARGERQVLLRESGRIRERQREGESLG